MGYYKGIYYADNATGMSNSQISYDEAHSYGNFIEGTSTNIPIRVGSQAERDALYPTDGFITVADGISVWRTDLGIEQRYSAFATTPGWYNATTGMMIIRAEDFSFGGSSSGSSGNITDFGVVNFTDKSSIYLNGIFSPAFTNYKIFFNLGKTSAGTDIAFQFTSDGVPNGSAIYSVANYYSNQAGTLTAAQTLTTTSGALIGSTGTIRAGLSELTLFLPYSTYPSFKALGNGFATGAGSPPWMWNQTGYFNSASIAFDGIVFFSNGADMTGSIMVYGFN